MSYHLRVMREHNLSMPQTVTLIFLQKRGGASLSEISNVLNLSLGGASHMVDDLVDRGYVHRVEDVRDRRHKHISLAQSGEEFCHTVIEGRLHRVAQQMSHLSPALIHNMIAVMSQAKDSLSQAKNFSTAK